MCDKRLTTTTITSTSYVLFCFVSRCFDEIFLQFFRFITFYDFNIFTRLQFKLTKRETLNKQNKWILFSSTHWILNWKFRVRKLNNDIIDHLINLQSRIIKNFMHFNNALFSSVFLSFRHCTNITHFAHTVPFINGHNWISFTW